MERRELTELQEIAAANMETELLSFLRPDVGLAPDALAGGRARLQASLLSLSSASPGDFLQDSGGSSTALPVDPSRVALPEIAGSIDPSKVLPPDRLRIFEAWESHARMPSDRWP